MLCLDYLCEMNKVIFLFIIFVAYNCVLSSCDCLDILDCQCLAQRRVLHFYFYERLAAARVEISSRSEQKTYGYDLLAPPTYCSRLSRKQRLWQKDGGTE